MWGLVITIRVASTHIYMYITGGNGGNSHFGSGGSGWNTAGLAEVFISATNGGGGGGYSTSGNAQLTLIEFTSTSPTSRACLVNHSI